jgi:hypothetical protein
MNALTRIVASAALAVGCAGAHAQTALQPLHLKGITAVNIVVFVDRDISGYHALETRLLGAVRASLTRAGLSADSPTEDLTLSVTAQAYPEGNVSVPETSLLTVSVELREPVALRRNPSLRIGGNNGAVTWLKESAMLERKADIPNALEREVLSQVGDFAADVAYANKK